jgi:hypothetical protein
MRRTFVAGPLMVAFALAACSPSPSPAPEADATDVTLAPAAAATAAAAADASTDTVPAAAIGAPLGEHDPAVVRYGGFGTADFGAGEEPVRLAWGRPLAPASLAGSKECYYLEMDPRPAGNAVAFMFEGGGFVRYDVFGTLPAAPGGFTVGALASDVVATFGSRVEQQPHEYLEGGRYLIVTPEYGEPGRLVFEVDGEGVVIQWRIGLPPQVHYVEGCA